MTRKRNHGLAAAVIAAALLSVPAFGDFEHLTVSGGSTETMHLSAEANQKSSTQRSQHYCYDLSGSGITLRLMGDCGGGEFPLRVAIYANNPFTIDATLLSNCTGIRWTGSTYCNNGQLVTVKGVNRVVFGEEKPVALTDVDIQTFYMNMTFTDASGAADSSGQLVFTNGCTVSTKPTCSWRVAAGTCLWVDGTKVQNLFGRTTDAEYVVDGFTLGVFTTGKIEIAAQSVRVLNGGILAVRGTSLGFGTSGGKAARMGLWSSLQTTFSRNVVLDGEAARIVCLSPVDATASANISGSGVFEHGGPKKLTLSGAVSYTGETEVSGGGTVVFSRTDGPASTRFVFSGPGDGGVEFAKTSVVLDEVSSTAAKTSTLKLGSGGTMDVVGSVSGDVGFAGPGTLTLDSVAAGARVTVSDLALNLRSCGLGVGLAAAGGTVSVSGPESGQTPSMDVTAPATRLTLGGTWTIGACGDNLDQLTVLAGGNITAVSSSHTQYQNNGGRLNLRSAAVATLALWTDASASGSLVPVKSVNPEADQVGDSSLIMWRDRRPEQTDYAWAYMRYRADDAAAMNAAPDSFPTILEDALDSKRAVELSAMPTHVMGLWSASTDWSADTRKFQTKAIPSRYAVTIARNPSGGIAIFGDREGKLERLAAGPTQGMFTNDNIVCHRNGALVSNASTFGRDFALFAFTTDGAQIDALASAAIQSAIIEHSGGFDYAETMIFTAEMPTGDRVNLERYLSQKWSLPVNQSEADYEQSKKKYHVSGFGELVIEDMDLSELSGGFSGRVRYVNMFFGGDNTFQFGSGSSAVKVTGATIDRETGEWTVDVEIGAGVLPGEFPLVAGLPYGTVFKLGNVTNYSGREYTFASADGNSYISFPGAGFRILFKK